MADIDATESETESEEDGLQVTEVVESLACTVDLSGSTATQDQEATSSVHVPSLLSQLRAPRRSDLTCPRKIQQNATKRTQKSKPSCSTDPASISPAERVREFPNEALTVSAGKLFCSACREEVSLKRSIIKSHIKSAKHQRGQTAVARKQAREKDIVEALKDYDKQLHPAGETLPDPQRVFRVKVVMSFLRAGAALSKLQYFREVLEKHTN